MRWMLRRPLDHGQQRPRGPPTNRAAGRPKALRELEASYRLPRDRAEVAGLWNGKPDIRQPRLERFDVRAGFAPSERTREHRCSRVSGDDPVRALGRHEGRAAGATGTLGQRGPRLRDHSQPNQAGDG